jgi:putative ABC transport system permease protein
VGISLAAARLIATPFFTIFAVLSLATGVAVTTAVYSVVDALFLRELGVRDPDRVAVVVPSYDRGSGRVLISEPDFRDLRAAQRSFASLSATAVFYPAVSSSVTTEVLAAEAVDGAYFSTLGVDAALGRVLQPADEEGTRHVAVVSHALWRLRFASDPAIVGQVSRIGGQPFEIAGVAARSYAGVIGGLDGTRLWIPLAAEARLPASTTADAANSRERRRLQVFGRLAPAATVSAASAEVASIGARLEAAFPRKSQAGAVRLSERTWGAKTVADPWMLVATPIPVIAAAFCACYMPARRAARVDPTVALRYE